MRQPCPQLFTLFEVILFARRRSGRRKCPEELYAGPGGGCGREYGPRKAQNQAWPGESYLPGEGFFGAHPWCRLAAWRAGPDFAEIPGMGHSGAYFRAQPYSFPGLPRRCPYPESRFNSGTARRQPTFLCPSPGRGPATPGRDLGAKGKIDMGFNALLFSKNVFWIRAGEWVLDLH